MIITNPTPFARCFWCDEPDAIDLTTGDCVNGCDLGRFYVGATVWVKNLDWFGTVISIQERQSTPFLMVRLPSGAKIGRFEYELTWTAQCECGGVGPDDWPLCHPEM
jgi:hypothetical protein